MWKKYKYLIVLLATTIVVFVWYLSNQKQHDVDLSQVTKTVTIHHFDDAFFTSDIGRFNEEFGILKSQFPPFFESNSDFDFWIHQRQDQGQNQLYTDWKNQLKNYKTFDSDLTLAFKHLYYYYPTLPEFEVYTYISNLDLENPIIAADKYIFIGVDLYLGKNHPAYQREPDYLNYFKQKAFINRDVVEAIALNIIPREGGSQTLLSQMIYWGKMRYFNEAMNVGINDTIVQKMNSKQLTFCLANEENMWTYFIKNQLLYDTSFDVQRKFIEPAPFSKFGMPFDAETPGMIGRWIGYRIVSSYMKNNPAVTLKQLMKQTDTRIIFKNSKYKP